MVKILFFLSWAVSKCHAKGRPPLVPLPAMIVIGENAVIQNTIRSEEECQLPANKGGVNNLYKY